MDFSAKVPHTNLVMYLRGNSTPVTDAAIQKLQKEETAFRLLFDLIQNIRKQNSVNFNRAVKKDTLTFEQLEILLENLFAGNATGNEKQLFIDLLLSSPSFYRRLMIKLHHMSPALAVGEIPEFSGEFKHLRSDEELLKAAGIISTKKRDEGVDGKETLLEKIKEFFRPRKLVPAIVFAAILIFFSINITRVPYNNYWEKPAFMQLSEFRGSELRSGGQTSEISKQYNLLKAVFSRSLTAYRNEQYAGVIQTFTLPQAQTAIQAIEMWINTREALNSMPNEPEVAEMQRLVQGYYFYLGASYIGKYRKEKKSLFKISDSQHLAEAIQLLSKAEMLADSYLLNTGDREKYYLGLAYAINKNKQTARLELAKVRPGNVYYPKAQELLKKLN